MPMCKVMMCIVYTIMQGQWMMNDNRYGQQNMNIQSIVSAVFNNLHLMPNSACQSCKFK
jgi:hypothetical protein